MDPRGVPYPLLPLAAWDLSGRGVRAARARCQRRGTGSPDRPRATTRNALSRMVFRNAISYLMSSYVPFALRCAAAGCGVVTEAMAALTTVATTAVRVQFHRAANPSITWR